MVAFFYICTMEVWKDIKNYEGYYQVSNFGNVKSLSREMLVRGKYPFVSKEKLLKKALGGQFLTVALWKDSVVKTKTVHQLMAETFLNHNPNGHNLVVRHKDMNKLNNHIDNLEIVTQREVSIKNNYKKTSKYTGVSWNNKYKAWVSFICINGNTKYLGRYSTELEAHNKYQQVLKDLSLNKTA